MRTHHDTNAGAACQVEKVDHATALQMTKTLGSIKQVGTSLGSFSVSSALMTALLEEFAPELAAKCEALDSDPHFWMPLTLKEYRAWLKEGGLAAENKAWEEAASQHPALNPTQKRKRGA